MIKTVSSLVGATAMAAAVSFGAAGVASASTTAQPGHDGATFALACANGFSGNVLVRRHLVHPAHAHAQVRWFVAHVVGGKKDAKVLVPTKIDVTFAFTDSAGNVTTTVENLTKKARAGKQTTCTMSGTATIDKGSLAATGSITGAFH